MLIAEKIWKLEELIDLDITGSIERERIIKACAYHKNEEVRELAEDLAYDLGIDDFVPVYNLEERLVG